MKFNRIFFWLLLVVFAGLTIWWTFYFTFSREKLYRAIPPNALFVSEHANLAERWKSIARNPLTLCVLATAGFDQKNLNEAVIDPGMLAMLDKFASKNTVIAYVPALGSGNEPAWILSSWVGGSGQVFKWYTSGMLAKANLKKVRLEGGRQIWQVIKKDKPADPELSIAMVEGIILACLSNDPSGVRYMVDRIERGIPLTPELREQMTACSTDVINDHGFFRLQNGNVYDQKILKYIYEFNEFGSNSLKGSIKGDAGLLYDWMGSVNSSNRVNYDLNRSPVIKNIPSIIGRAPDAFAVVPFRLVEPVLTGRHVSRGVKIISKAIKLQSVSDSAVFVSMFGGGLSGRILGIKVPALMAGVTVNDDCNYVARISETVDVLNALYKSSLIPRREEIAGRVVVAIDSTRQQGVYDSIAPTDKPAITVRDHWLAMSSSLGTLSNVVCVAGQGEVVAKQQWGKGLDYPTNCAGYAWINLDATGEALKNAIAAYTLVLIAQNSPNALETRKKLTEFQTWLNVVKPLKTCELKLIMKEPDIELLFSFGEH